MKLGNFREGKIKVPRTDTVATEPVRFLELRTAREAQPLACAATSCATLSVCCSIYLQRSDSDGQSMTEYILHRVQSPLDDEKDPECNR